MSTGTIFFSYSREDSEFVLNLAKELRAAGADVWMDQMDIEAGTRWDLAIENALKSSSTLLVVLSKSSVESENVMVEVNYALSDKTKKIVPVLMEECDIPFRLQLHQFADFRKDHETGIKSLIASLSLEDQVATKLREIGGKKSPTPVVKPEPEKLEKKKEVEEKKPLVDQKPAPDRGGADKPLDKPKPPPPVAPKPDNKKIYIAIAAAVVLIVVLMASGVFGGEDDSDDHRSDAGADPVVTSDQQAWENIASMAPLGAFLDHRNEFGADCVHEDQIQTMVDESDAVAQAQAEDDAEYNFAKRTGTVKAYLEYMDKYPEGDHLQEASQWILDELDATHWVFYGMQSNGEMTGNRFFNNWSADSDNALPEEGQMVIVSRPATLRTVPNSNSGSTNKATKLGAYVIVEEVQEDGNGIWVKINYKS